MVTGRSGYVIPANLLAVPPNLARLLLALTDDAPAQFRQRGSPVPAEWIAWRSDLEDYANRVTPEVQPDPEPAAWLDVGATVAMFEIAGLTVSDRTIRQWASTGRLRAKRHGRRAWLLASDDVEAEIDARIAATTDRKHIGSRYSSAEAS